MLLRGCGRLGSTAADAVADLNSLVGLATFAFNEITGLLSGSSVGSDQINAAIGDARSYAASITGMAIPSGDPQVLAAQHDIVGALNDVVAKGTVFANDLANASLFGGASPDDTQLLGSLNAVQYAIAQAQARGVAGDTATTSQVAAVDASSVGSLDLYNASIAQQQQQAHAQQCSIMAYWNGDSGIPDLATYATTCADVNPTLSALMKWLSLLGTYGPPIAIGGGVLIGWHLLKKL